jgi:trimethylamine corrinoid protein
VISNERLNQAREALMSFDATKALGLVDEVAAENENPLELLEKAFIPAINEIGEKFGTGEMFLPELIQAAEVMKQVTARVSENLPRDEAAKQARGGIVIGTVEGDVHDIGKTLVVTMLGVHGFEVFDLGRDIATEKFIQTARDKKAKLIGSSALLTTTMTKQKEIEEALKEAGLKGQIKTMVGGSPVTQRWAERIGADAFGENAHDAAVKAKQLVSG